MQNIQDIKHLVLSGGGMLGISYIGFLKYLEEHSPSIQFHKQLKTITGCSAGAIFSILIALGYSSIELEVLFKNIIFKDYLHINADSIINFNRLKGLDSNTKLMKLIKQWIKFKTNNEDITFKQLRDKYSIIIQIGVTCLSKSSFEIINYINSPDLEIHKAISASIAIPLVFEPVCIGNELYCDGSLLDNLPIENIKYLVNSSLIKDTLDNKDALHTNDIGNGSILGIYLMNQQSSITKDNYQTLTISKYIGIIFSIISEYHINTKINAITLNTHADTHADTTANTTADTIADTPADTPADTTADTNTDTYLNNRKIVNNINTMYKIIVLKIPGDIMTFIKLNASHSDIENIIDIAYNKIRDEYNQP